MQVCPDLGHRISLRAVLPEASFLGGGDVCAAGCTCDWRHLAPGDLLVALPDAGHDHESLAEAAARGCAGVLADRSTDPAALAGLPVPVCLVADAREAYGRICHALVGDPSRQMKVIGVAGTHGKTTTSCLIASILTTAGHRIGMLGALGHLDGRVIEDAVGATPPAGELATWLARMAHNECTHAVVEVSSRALEDRHVAGVRFDAACVTSVVDARLDPQTRNAHRRSKAELLARLPEEGVAVINADDPLAAGCVQSHRGPVLTVGIDRAAEIMAIPVEQHLSEQTFLLTAGSETVPVRTPMIGTEHIYNCLTAAAVGLVYGIDLMTVVRGLEAAGHVPGQLERIECGQPFGVFVDEAPTADALKQALATLRAASAGRVICVFGTGGHQQQPCGRWAESLQGADRVVVTSDSPTPDNAEAPAAAVLAEMPSSEAVELVLDRAEAIRRALELARPGDCVLIAGMGPQTYPSIDGDSLPLDDAQIARQLLYEMEV